MWTVIIAYIILKGIDVIMGLRVPLHEELLGADLVEHSMGNREYDKKTRQIRCTVTGRVLNHEYGLNEKGEFINMAMFDLHQNFNGQEPLKDNLHSVIALPESEPHSQANNSNITAQNFDNYQQDSRKRRKSNDYIKARILGQQNNQPQQTPQRTSSAESFFSGGPDTIEGTGQESKHDNIHPNNRQDSSSTTYPRQHNVNTLKNQMHKIESQRDELLKTIREEASKNVAMKSKKNSSTPRRKSDNDKINYHPGDGNHLQDGGEDNLGYT